MKLNKQRAWIGVIFLFWLAVLVQPVFAHAVPLTSSPLPNSILDAAPAEIMIQFNEPIVPALSRIVLLAQAGAAVEVGELTAVSSENRALQISLPQSLNDGAYLVSWQVLSAVDGHTTSGSFSFGVGKVVLTAVSEDSTIQADLSPLSAAARWLTLTGTSLLMGLFAFRLLVWNPVLVEEELTAEEEALDLAHAQAGVKIGMGGLALIAVGLLLIFVDQNQLYNLFQFDNFQTWISTQFGLMWLARFFLIAIAHFNLSLFVNVKSGRQELRGWEWWAGLFLAMGLALTNALVSHSAALQSDTLTAVFVDWTHVVAATMWVGGLLFLVVGLWQARTLAAEERSWLNLSLFLNFSALAAIAVGFLTASGLYLSWQHVGSWTSLVGTAYGVALLVKLAIAAIIFIIAGVNLFVVKPKLQAAYENPDEAFAAKALSRFTLLTRAEMILAFIVLLAAGILMDLQRGIDAPLLADAPGETTLAYANDDLDVEMKIEPALIGQNSFDMLLKDGNGDLITDASEVSIRYTFLGQSIGSDTAVAELMDNGRYRVEGSYISLIGGWQMEVTVRRPGIYDTFAPFRLEAGLGGNIRSEDGGNLRLLERFAKFMTLAGSGGTGLALVLFAIVWGIIGTRAARSEWHLIPLLLVCLLAFWTGSRQLIEFFDVEYTPAKFTTNPILPDVESVAIGQQFFTENCIACHGELGIGDGPAASALTPPPADFTDGHTATHTDGDIFYWVLEGVEGTAMPAFGEQFEREEVWHLVNYVRRLSAGSG